jgi:MarR family transcriptional regulator, organic hydroperoxide resistance regulator
MATRKTADARKPPAGRSNAGKPAARQAKAKTFNPEDWPIAWMARAERQHARNSTLLLKPLGLHHREFRVLTFLARNPGVSVGKLADVAVLERPTVSKMIDRLEAAGLVARGQHESDGRRAPLSLTAQGEALLSQAAPLINGLFERYCDHLSAAERRRFVQTMREFFEAVRRAEPASTGDTDES